MNTKIRPVKSLKLLSLCFILAGIAIPLCFMMSIVSGETTLQQTPRSARWIVAWSPIVSVLGILLLVAYRHWTIELDERGSIHYRTPITHWSIDLPHLTSVKWQSKTNRVFLSQSGIQHRIDFDMIDPADRLELIRSIRNSSPLENQNGWAPFCHRFALPLRKRYRPGEPLETGERRFAGRRTDVIFVVTTVLALAIAGVLAFLFSLPMLLWYPCILLAVWPFVRLLEKPGQTVLKTDLRQGVAVILMTVVTAIALSSIVVVQRLAIPHADSWSIGFAFAFLAILVCTGTLLGARNREANELAQTRSADRWEALEQALVE